MEALGNPGVLFTYEGVLTDTSGTPIVTTQTVTLQILHHSSCVVYSETHDVLPGSSGEFSVQVGTGVRLDSTGNSADRIFASSGTVGCQGGTTVSLSGFSPRTLRVQIGSVVLSPDVVVGNVPVAINSQKLADKGPESFIQTSSEITQGKVESILSRYAVLDWLLGMLPVQTPGSGQVLMAQGGQYKPGNIVAGTNVTANPPLVAVGTDAVSLSLPMAGAASDGYLSSTDWIPLPAN